MSLSTKGTGPLTTLRRWAGKLSRMSRNRAAWCLSFQVNRKQDIFLFFNGYLKMWKNVQLVLQCGELLVLMLFLFMLREPFLLGIVIWWMTNRWRPWVITSDNLGHRYSMYLILDLAIPWHANTAVVTRTAQVVTRNIIRALLLWIWLFQRCRNFISLEM